MYQPLVPCPDCQRHVRVADSDCPFCGAALPSDLHTKVIPSAPRRLSRGAAFVFGAALAVTACGSEVESPGNTSGAGGAHDGGTDDDGGGMALYGVPEPDGGPSDDGGGMSKYGAPPPPTDAGPDDGGGGADYGAPPPMDGGSQPLYGAPPPPP